MNVVRGREQHLEFVYGLIVPKLKVNDCEV
jgi:hypothetical protein